MSRRESKRNFTEEHRWPSTSSQPEAKTESTPDAKAKTPSDLTPRIVKRVHELYEELGRNDLQAVEDLEQAEREIRKDEAKEKG